MILEFKIDGQTIIKGEIEKILSIEPLYFTGIINSEGDIKTIVFRVMLEPDVTNQKTSYNIDNKEESL